MNENKEPREMTVDDVRLIMDEIGVTDPTATTFFPSYYDGVVCIGPPPTPPTPVSPDLCLTIASCFALMVILEDLEPVAYLDAPQVFEGGSHFQYSRRVPWLRFNNGAVRNAGSLAFNWNANSGDPSGNLAEEHARQDIAWG